MTIKDLSAQTGYSVGTISRALNNHPNVSRRPRNNPAFSSMPTQSS